MHSVDEGGEAVQHSADAAIRGEGYHSASRFQSLQEAETRAEEWINGGITSLRNRPTFT